MVGYLAIVQVPGIGASELNTLLLIVGLPGVAWIGRKLIKSVDGLNATVAKLDIVLLGTDGQGGLVRRVEGVAKQGHDHAGKLQVLEGEIEDLKERVK